MKINQENKKNGNKKDVFILLAIAVLLVIILPGLVAEEGMWPLSEIHKLDLKSRGLKISAEDIFSPDTNSLVYAIVQIGATGSFVSEDGLILTNHHVAFNAVQAASSPERDYLKNGFIARTRTEEIEARGMTARIAESFRDVSKEVLGAVKPGLTPEARTEAIKKKIKEIEATEEKANPGKRVEVSEMFPGKSYVLFVYTDIKDIRLVYVPPRSIGEFGGEEDNWMWPRHTGDFAFLRAYVGPDGKPADYSKNNLPFKPRRFLKIEPRGVKENDPVFLLGYPGRTSRHMTSHFLSYEEEIRMPYVADWYEWQIALMEKMGKDDRAVALKHAARIKSLANTMKNFRGKLQGMKRLRITERKREEERALQSFIEKDARRKAAAGELLSKFGSIYQDMRQDFERRMITSFLRSQVNLVNAAFTVYEASIERPKKDAERAPEYTDRNFSRTVKRLELSLENTHLPTDQAILKELLRRASKVLDDFQSTTLKAKLSGLNTEKDLDEFISNLYSTTGLLDKAQLNKNLSKSQKDLMAASDPALELAAALYLEVKAVRRQEDAWNGLINELYPKLLDVKEAYLSKNFIPDANSTLRLTLGKIKGYTPRDAVFYHPFTTLTGLLEKTTGEEPFDTPDGLVALIKAGDYGRYLPEGFSNMPVCILYDADTTGGNSGSPVLNARGEVVGVNFDRTFEATINDFAWSADYSRSIGVDIRFILWLLEKFAQADFLLRELGVSEKN